MGALEQGREAERAWGQRVTEVNAHLVNEAAQDWQVSGGVRGEDVACCVDPRHWQDAAGEVHEGVCEEDMLVTV